MLASPFYNYFDWCNGLLDHTNQGYVNDTDYPEVRVQIVGFVWVHVCVLQRTGDLDLDTSRLSSKTLLPSCQVIHSRSEFTADELLVQIWPLPCKWTTLGTMMEIRKDLLDDIESEGLDEVECCKQMLGLYMADKSKEHTCQEINSYLEQVANVHLAQNQGN